MTNLTLNNGVVMPQMGFGVYQIPEDQTAQAVVDAIASGYRKIDTAQSYFNEAQVGEGLRRAGKELGVKREDIFITTKIWLSNYGYDKTKASVKASMARLGVDYIDLVLLHQPFSDYYGSYRALEDLYDEGVLKAIGVSNFYPDRIADLAAFARITPMVNQVEINPLNQQIAAQANMEKWHVQPEAWAPFGEGKSGMFQNETLIAIGKKYGKSPAQVILRWLIQRGISINAKSTHKERMQQNIDIFDFELTASDMDEIRQMDTGKSLFFNHESPEAVDMFLGFLKEREGRV